MDVDVIEAAGGGAGAVTSVATRTGDVVLTAADVGAGQLPSGVLLPSGVIIPSGADISGILGSSGSKAAAGNDARLSDARTPTAHAASHRSGGSDAITIDQFAAAAADVNFGTHKGTNAGEPSAATDLATKNYVDTSNQPLVLAADPEIPAVVGVSNAVMTAALTPVFQPIRARGLRSYPVSQLGLRVTTTSAAQTFGLAIYSIVYTDATHWTATLVAQLNAAGSTAANGIIKGDGTTGAAGSGAAVATLDFTQNKYVLGSMSSDLTAAFAGVTLATTLAKLGYVVWTAAARASTTDWPSSFTETSSGAASAVRCANGLLFTAAGKNIP